MEHARRDVIGSAMSTIDNNLQTSQIKVIGEGALAELDITTACIFYALDPSQLSRWHTDHGPVDPLLDSPLHVVR